MTIAGNACNLYPYSFQLFKIFPDFFVAFPVGESVHLSILDVVIIVQDQAQIIFEVGSVNDQVCCLLAAYLKARCLAQILFEQSLQGASTGSFLFAQININLSLQYPFAKPNKLLI